MVFCDLCTYGHKKAHKSDVSAAILYLYFRWKSNYQERGGLCSMIWSERGFVNIGGIVDHYC